MRLYANVGATAFLVSKLEEFAIEYPVEPVMASALAGTAASLVPGTSLLTGVITQSIPVGAANAFLPLRIGVLWQRYCGSLTAVDRRRMEGSQRIHHLSDAVYSRHEAHSDLSREGPGPAVA